MFDNTSTITDYSHKSALTKSFLWMFLGLTITAVVAGVTFTTGFIYTLFSIPFVNLVVIFFPFILCIFFGSAMRSSSSTKIKMMFLLYAFSLGFSMSTLALSYNLGMIATAFGISALYFLCLTFIGFTTKKDLSKLGTICMVGIFVIIFSQLLFMLFHVTYSVRLYSIVGLILFTGITAWDVQRMNKILMITSSQAVEQEKIAIYFALQLYLDFLNIFLYILQLLGLHSDN